jgi:hypothetical protein
MSKVLIALLSKAYNLTSEQTAELLKKSDEEQETEVLALDAARVKEWKETASKRFDDGHKKGKSESLTTHEKGLREKYGISEPLTGEELIGAIIATEVEKTGKGGKPGEITPDVIRKHPEYLKMEAKFKDELTKTTSDWENKYKEAESQFNKKSKFSQVRSKALDLLDTLNPVLSSDKTKAARQKGDFIRDLESYDFDITDDGKVLVLDKDGSPLQDQHGHTRSFEDFAKELASARYDFADPAQQQSSPANGGKTTIKVGGKTFPFKKADGTTKELPKPKNMEELTAVIRSADYSPEEKKAVNEAFKAGHVEN